MSNYVIISKAPNENYHENFVSLPKNFGSSAYYARKDIQIINEVVTSNLQELENNIHFLSQLSGKKVIIKPNLVSVFHEIGFVKQDYPETTDPRVIDAVIRFIRPYAKEIIIAESSGRGMPTHVSFKLTGLNYLAKFYKIRLVSLEEQAVDRYILPKAKVMREVYIPKLFSEVVRGDAFYISIPKMKTNLYTQVTLGFKNAMGILPYNLRQRNHNYMINEKLVDLMYLIKPNLTVIDGLIGGEGNTPAPVDPVESHLIISGNNAVETDRVTTRIMGLDPNTVKLTAYASKLGFGDPNVTIIGPQEEIPFLPADSTLLSDRFISQFPNTKLLVGHMKNNALKIEKLNSNDQILPEQVKQIEQACVGGCIPSIRTAFDYVRYMGHPTDFSLYIIIGAGVKIGDKTYYFDREGHAYTIDDIIKLPGKKLAMGSCTSALKGKVDLFLNGCMPQPASAVFALFTLTKQKNNLFQPMKNKHLISMLLATIRLNHIRKRMIRHGEWIDCPTPKEDKIFEPRPLSEAELQMDYIEWPLPSMTKKMRNESYKAEALLSCIDYEN